MKDWIKAHKLEITIFCVAFILRGLLFSFNLSQNEGNFVATIMGDDGYYQLSQSILDGNGFTFDVAEPYRPNPLRPPLWPYLIALFAKIFGGYWAVLLLELTLGSFIPILGMYVARRIVSEKLSKWVAGFLIFEPYLILLSFILYTETAFTFLFLVFLIFLFRYIEHQSTRNAIWTGVFLGLACMIKPTIQYFPILIPVALLILWRKKLVPVYVKHFVLFGVTFLLIIAPWLYRNYHEFGVVGMSAQPAFNLYVYLAPTVLAIDNKTDFRTEYEKFVKKDNFDENNINLSNSAFYKDEAMKIIKEHKIALIKSMFISGITFFTHDGMLTVLGYSGIRITNTLSKPIISLLGQPVELLKTVASYAGSPAIVILIMRLIWILITILFLIGAFLLLKREGATAPILAGLLMVLYFAITTCINGLGVNARFRIPVDVFIFSFAIYAVFAIKERIKPTRT